jgi:tRNA (guanine-N(7)-)-methyltransferase subunit TRM82
MTGEEKHDISIQEVVEPFIVVKGKKRRWFEEAEMDDENPTVRVKQKGRKRKGKGKAKEVPEEPQDDDMEETRDGGTPVPANAEGTPEDGPQESIRPEVEELVLAIRKIDSFETPRGKHLVFSAVGYVLSFFSLPHPPLTPYFKLHSSVCLFFSFTRCHFISYDLHL